MSSTHHSFIVSAPKQMNQAFADAYNSGDIENLLALYESEACLVSQTGEAHIDFKVLQTDLQDLLAFKGKMTSENQYTYQVGNIALLSARWRLVGTQSTGKPLELQGASAEVVRKQPDGR
jgi:ketosteroid isomerase-like protein